MREFSRLVAGDWTGSGVVRIGVFRQGAWYFDLNNDGAFEANEGPFYFGLPGDTAIVGDWTGSGAFHAIGSHHSMPAKTHPNSETNRRQHVANFLSKHNVAGSHRLPLPKPR